MNVEERVKPGYYPEFPIDRILQPKFSFRRNVDEGIDDLMYQIFTAGMVIEPIICRPAPDRPGYVEVGPGERRLRAAKRLHMMTIPVIVREMDDAEFDRIRMLENLARKDLSDIEIARILKHMLKNYPKEYPSQQVLANALGKTRQWVFYHLKMLELEDLLTRVNNWSEILSKITERQAREILSAPLEKRVEVAKWIAEKYEETGEIPSAREIRRHVQDLLEAEEESKEEIAVESMRPAVQSMIESAEAVSIASELEPESSHGHVGEASLTRVNNKSSFGAEAEGGESEEVIVNAEAESRSDAGGGAEERAEVKEEAEARVCPVCGRPLEEEEYERLRQKFSRFSGLFD